MISLFLGLHTANLLLLSLAFGLGLFAVDPAQQPTAVYGYHQALGIGAGLMATLVHMAVFVYFMATTKWLEAATDKADLDATRFIAPSLSRKARVFAVAMAAIVITMLTMFAGAGADPAARPLWPGEVHLVMAALAIMVNLASAMAEYHYIRAQSSLMDEALAILNQPSSTAA